MAVPLVEFVDGLLRDLLFEIRLAPDNIDEAVGDSLLDGIIIISHFFKRLDRIDIIHKETSVAAFVVGGDYGFVSVLACSVVVGEFGLRSLYYQRVNPNCDGPIIRVVTELVPGQQLSLP